MSLVVGFGKSNLFIKLIVKNSKNLNLNLTQIYFCGGKRGVRVFIPLTAVF